MLRNRIVRWLAKCVGLTGRSIGLSRISILQRMYHRMAVSVLPDEDVLVTLDGQRMIIPNPKKHVLGRMVYLHQTWEDLVSQEVCASLRSGMTALDIGAHVGYFTLLMAKRVGPTGKVYSFEPNPATRSLLESNIRLNHLTQVTVCPVALFSRHGIGHLEQRENLNSVLSPQPSLVETMVEMVAYDRYAARMRFSTADVIKMDVEGAEYDIVQGMHTLLGEHHPLLIMEVHADGLARFGHTTSALFEYLESLGYSAERIWSQVGTTTFRFRYHPIERQGIEKSEDGPSPTNGQ
jgi:FkbM family methyltransferase